MTLKMRDKQTLVAKITEVATNASSVIVVDYRGLTVAEMTKLRSKARNLGVHLQVIRNTLTKRALQNTSYACLQERLVGPIFLAFSLEDVSAAARVIRDFAKEHEQLKVTALAIGSKLMAPSELDMLADLPTREQALAMIMARLLVSYSRVVRILQEPYAKFVRTMAVVGNRKTK